MTVSPPRGRPGPGANRLLTILPPASRERLHTIGRSVRLEFEQLLIHQGEHIEHVYFPYSGIISLVVLMHDGRGVDAATIGFEGMVGASVVLGEEQSPCEVMVQVPGEALQIPTAAFRQALHEDEALRDILLRSIEVLLVQAVRSVACNRLHTVEERLARWLLHAHDWVWVSRFHLTQEFLAAMLGVRRSTITIAAGVLQRAWAEQSDVHITVSDQGRGLPPDQLERIFEKFYRVPGQEGSERGSGLGLFICKRIVEAHGGRIWAESTPGRGSTFHVVLRRAEMEQAEVA